ncbi:MAG TPA: hypothetical protein VKD90_07380 [Gemmataceae bacterium]|nr:hypothetical protein [Gemmataceae bacterium]
MPFLTPCPKCGARLKSATRLPAGQRLTCPTCQHKFITLAESEPFTPGAGRKTPDDLPAAVLLDDPADDRPEVGRRREDDRPRRRRHADPVPRERRKPRRPLPPAALVGLMLGVLVLFVGVAVLCYSVWRDARKPAANDLMAHAPTDAVILSGYNLDELAANEAFRKSLERRAPPDLVELDRAGLRSADLSRVLVARTATNGNTCAVRFKAAPDRAKYLGPDLSGRQYAQFTSLTGPYRFGYFADATTLVLTESEPAIQDLRDRPANVRQLGGLPSMVDRIRGPVWRASGRVSANDFPRGGPEEAGIVLRVGPSAGSAAWLELDGRHGRVFLELTFDNPGQAVYAAGVLRSTFQVQRGLPAFGPQGSREWVDPTDAGDVRRGYDEATVTEDGFKVSARLTLPAGEALRAVGSVRY